MVDSCLKWKTFTPHPQRQEKKTGRGRGKGRKEKEEKGTQGIGKDRKKESKGGRECGSSEQAVPKLRTSNIYLQIKHF